MSHLRGLRVLCASHSPVWVAVAERLPSDATTRAHAQPAFEENARQQMEFRPRLPMHGQARKNSTPGHPKKYCSFFTGVFAALATFVCVTLSLSNGDATLDLSRICHRLRRAVSGRSVSSTRAAAASLSLLTCE